MPLPLVSVVIPTHNAQNHLRECLHSMDKTKYPNYEVIVVDAACTDGTYEMLRKDFPDVKVFRVGDIGYGETNNHGMIRAQGEYIVSICDDYTVHANWLDELVKVISPSKDIGIVGGKVYSYGTKNTIVFAGRKVTISLLGIVWGFGSVREREEYDEIRETVFSPVPMVRRNILPIVGLWDPDYFLQFDDTDFCFRVRKAGFRLVYVPTSITWHKIGGTTPLGSPRSVYYTYRNRIRFMMKNFPAYALLTAMPLSFVPFLRAALTFILHNEFKHFKALLRAFIWNLEHMRETIQARKYPFYQSFKRLPPQLVTHFIARTSRRSLA